MPLSDLPRISQDADLSRVVDYLIMLQRKLNDFLNHLDTLNVEELDANVILANTITADKLNVTQLSAIAADLGTITAGTIIGALIKTATSGQRVELSSVDNLMKAINASGNYVSILPDYSGSPAFEFSNGTDSWIIYLSGSTLVINSVGAADIQISSTSGYVDVFVGSGKQFRVPAWSSILNRDASQSLQSALDAKANAFSGYTGTLYVATTSGGAATHPITVSNGVITS